MKLSYIVVIFLLSVVYSKISDYPVYPTILTLSTPLPDLQERVGYPLVRWLEASGIDVVAVHTWTEEATIDELLTKVNGVVFQGDSSDVLDIDSAYYIRAKYIYDKAVQMSKIPIIAIGNDMNMITSFETGKVDHIETISQSSAKRLIFTDFDKFRNFTLFSELSIADLIYINGRKINLFDLYTGIPKEYFRSSQKFELISTFEADNKTEYAAIIKSKENLVYGIGFNPEKICYDSSAGLESIDAVSASRFIGDSVSKVILTNPKTFIEEEKRKYDFIHPVKDFPKKIGEKYAYLFSK